MITKYIGSVNEFINCESVALVNVIDSVTLVESEIPNYSPTNIYFNRIKLVNRSSDGSFVARFTRDEQIGFVVNYVIMYNAIGSPIGFTNLTQDINLYKYNIESITVSFDFVVVNEKSNISVNINYVAHEVMTSKRAAHLNLFEGHSGAVSKSDIDIEPKEGFTNNYIHAFRNKTLIYRYSGKLSVGDCFLDHDCWVIKKDIIDKSRFIDIMDNGSERFLAIVYDSGMRILSPTRDSNFDITVESYNDFGSNLVVGRKYGGDKKIYSMNDLIIGVDNPLKTVHHVEPGVVDESDIVSSHFTIKDPIDKSIIFYRKVDSNIVTDDKYLNGILYDFNNPKFLSGDIVYSSKGMMFVSDHKDDVINSVGYYTFSLPGVRTNMGTSPRYSSDPGESKEIDKLLNMICKGTKLSDITFITKDLFIVNNSMISYYDFYENSKIKYDNESTDVLGKYPYTPKTLDEHVYFISDADYRKARGKNKYLIECSSDFNYERDVYSSTYKLKIRPFIGDRIGLKNLDKVSRSVRYNLRDKTIIPTSSGGSLFAFIEDGEFYRLSRL